MKTTIHAFMLVTILAFSGCRKDNEEIDDSPLLIPQEVKDYSLFQPGTYWIYIDSVSGRVDSVYVYETAHALDTIHYNSSPRSVFEIYVVKAHSFMDGYDYYIEANATYSLNDPNVFDVFHEKLKPGDYVGRSIMFIYKPFKGQTIYDSNAIKHINDIYPSLTINGINYKNVIDISYDKSYVDPCKNVRKLISSNFGIIRKEYIDSNQVWILARSHIIQ